MTKDDIREKIIEQELKKKITKESAEKTLKELGIIDSDGNVTEEYSETFVKINN